MLATVLNVILVFRKKLNFNYPKWLQKRGEKEIEKGLKFKNLIVFEIFASRSIFYKYFYTCSSYYGGTKLKRLFLKTHTSLTMLVVHTVTLSTLQACSNILGYFYTCSSFYGGTKLKHLSLKTHACLTKLRVHTALQA